MEFLEIPHVQTYSLREYYSRNIGERQFMSQNRARLETLAPYVDAHLRIIAFGDAQRNEPARPRLAQKAFAKAVRMTQKEFESLSKQTEKMTRVQRMTFILNYLTDGQL